MSSTMQASQFNLDCYIDEEGLFNTQKTTHYALDDDKRLALQIDNECFLQDGEYEEVEVLEDNKNVRVGYNDDEIEEVN
ncbi:hypothetical protein FQN55_000454 [Onygenales sp. PD_40]|nr:hypothetical protein FQN55_000454 [Onygenales sp. PD_40]